MAKRTTNADRMFDLFSGWDKAHGVFKPGAGKPDQKGKVKGKQSTDRTPPTPELWKAHLKGEIGLGVYMLRLDSTVRFAAIDVDVYPLDSAPILERIKKSKFPLVFCKSKSGGAHLYIFGKEDLPASLVRQRLSEWAATLGFPKYELYPHKDELRNASDFGKYLNMPYFGNERWALDSDGKELHLKDFIPYALSMAVTRKELANFKGTSTDDLAHGPPCLQSLLSDGTVSDFRDNTLVNLGTYLRMRHPEEWESKVEEYHRKYIEPQMASREVVKVIKSVGKKDYNYMCSQEPITGRCSKEVCITRQYGVRAKMEENDQEVNGFNLNLGTLTKYKTDPPTWELEVNGEILRLTTDQLMEYPRFRKAVLEALNTLPILLKAKSWNLILDDKLASLEEVEAPGEAGIAGQILEKLQQFCTHRQARSRDELKEGRAWWTDDGVYFRMTPFLEYLQKYRIYQKPRELGSLLRSWGYEHGQFNLKGSLINWWKIPPFDVQTEPDDVPRPGEVRV